MSERRDDYLSEHIRDRLIHDSRVNEQDLTVEVRAQKVILGGNVSTEHLRKTVYEVTSELLPDYEVVNETKIVSAAEPDGEEPLT